MRAQDVEAGAKNSMLVVSEFVGCSPSVSGALRVNPWSINSVADGIYSAIKMPLADRHLRHDKHWRYVSQHTAKFWAQARPPRESPPRLARFGFTERERCRQAPLPGLWCQP